MRLSIFQKHQNESTKPFMCFNPDHEMTLVPLINDNLIVELKCFFPDCGFSLKPGYETYLKLIKEQTNV